MDGGSIGVCIALLSSGVDVPFVPMILSLLGAGVLFVFAVQAMRRSAPRRPRPVHAAVEPPPPPVMIAPPPPPPAPAAPATYKKAPFAIQFPTIKPDYPDVWGLGEPIDIVLRTEDKNLQALRQIPGLTASIDGEGVAPAFSRGVGSVRKAFSTLGEKLIVVEMRFKNETQPRRAQRPLKIVEYRTEIAEVFTNFREEASRAIAPIREDATPWEIYDILTAASPKLPPPILREIISSFEEAKYSNHPVTRVTYERMIDALLQLERVEL